MTASVLTAPDDVVTCLPDWVPLSQPPFDPHWTTQARCANDSDPDQWVNLPPLRIRGRINEEYQSRLADLADKCATCPARPACLWQALTSDVVGVWAGTDEADRVDLRRMLGLTEPAPLTGTTLPSEQERIAALSATWRNVRHLARSSMSSGDIASTLGLSPMTVSRLLDERQPDNKQETAA